MFRCNWGYRFHKTHLNTAENHGALRVFWVRFLRISAFGAERSERPVSAVPAGPSLCRTCEKIRLSRGQFGLFPDFSRVLSQRPVQRSGLSRLVLWGCHHRTAQPASRRCPTDTADRFLHLF